MLVTLNDILEHAEKTILQSAHLIPQIWNVSLRLLMLQRS